MTEAAPARAGLVSYRLEGRLEMLPPALFGQGEAIIFLPPCPEADPPAEPLFWLVDEKGRRLALAWPGGAALDHEDALAAIRIEASFGLPRPLMTRLPVHPHRLPPRLRAWARRLLAPKKPAGVCFPRWPIEPSLEAWRHIGQAAGLTGPPWTWPDGAGCALCLSHDVDTAVGQKNAEALAEVEESLGLRSVWFLLAGNYEIDAALWQEMAARGHEIACHGLNHDFKLGYLPPNKMAARLDKSLARLAQFKPQGFRTPGFFRTPALMEALAERFSYDSSLPDTRSQPAPNGCASLFPFRLGGLTELPVTMPADGEMIALGLGAYERTALWREKAGWIKSLGGLIHLLTHPDPEFTATADERETYRRFLAELLDGPEKVWAALPLQITALADRADNG